MLTPPVPSDKDRVSINSKLLVFASICEMEVLSNASVIVNSNTKSILGSN